MIRRSPRRPGRGFTNKRLSQILFTRNIQGVVVAPMPRARGHLSLEWSHLASTVIGYSCTQPNLHRVTKDDFRNTLLALRRLKHRGYRRVGLVVAQLQQNERGIPSQPKLLLVEGRWCEGSTVRSSIKGCKMGMR